MEGPSVSTPTNEGALAGLALALQRHLETYHQEVATTRGAQAALEAALDRLQGELAAADEAARSRVGAPSLARLAKLRERLHRISRVAAEVEHRVASMRGHVLARQASCPGGAGSTG